MEDDEEKGKASEGGPEAGSEPGFEAIFDILRTKGGYDFRFYKRDTLLRRIRRRMALAKIAAAPDYAGFLRENPEEIARLRKDLLIGVTDFFRQPQAWEILEKKIIIPLVDDAAPRSEIRIWVPGCSTGKEAYSLAMLLAERIAASKKDVGYQIFATDADAGALAVARAGLYSAEDVGGHVPAERLKRFFTRREGRFQVIKEIRAKIVFAPQNITADPPFSHLDLISCRNLLIYIDSQIKRKIITLFHFALREGGFLFLGSAETVGDREDLFEPVSKKWRIYRRIGIGRSAGLEIPAGRAAGAQAQPSDVPAIPGPTQPSLASSVQQFLLDRFAPASVVIDRKLQVLYSHGPVEQYLTLPAGELSTRIVEMAREGLRARLRGAIAKCLEINRPVTITARVQRGPKSVPVQASVSLLKSPREIDGLLLVAFEDYPVAATKSKRPRGAKDDFLQLQDELKVTREELQSTIEQLEGSNDQLKASNEEVTAANEELQSANEELETSKEELQSLNEELNTINARLQDKVEEVEGVNNDLLNLLSSTNIATIFLDKDLRIKRYTPASTRLFSLIQKDLGRPLSDIQHRFSDPLFLDDADKVLRDLTAISKDIRAEDGGWYIRRISPYRTLDDRIEGVVVTFVDVCDIKASEEALRRKQADLEVARVEAENGRLRLEAVMEALPIGVAILDAQGGAVRTNSAFAKVWGGTPPPTAAVEDYTGYQAWWPETGAAVAPDEWAAARAVRRGESVVGQLVEIQKFDGTRGFALNSASPVRDASGDVVGGVVAIEDVTELRKAEAALRESRERSEWLARFPEENTNPVLRVSAEGAVLYVNPTAFKLKGWECRIGRPLAAELRAILAEAIAQGKTIEADAELAGTPFAITVVPVSGEDYANIYGRDISARKAAEEALARLNSELESRVAEQTAEIRRTHETVNTERQRLYDVLETLPAYVILLTPDYHVPFSNRVFRERFGEARGRCCYDFLFQRADPCPGCETYKVLKTKVPHHWEWTGPDGRDYDVFDYPFKDTDGSPLILEMGIDITERKKAEAALKEINESLERRVAERSAELALSEERFRRVLQNAPVVVANLDPRLRYTWIYNPQGGFQPEDVLGREVGLSVDPEGVRRIRESLGRVLSEGASVNWESVTTTAAGEMCFESHAEPLRDAGGAITGIALVSFDISERKRAEQALRESNEELARFNRAAVGRELRMIDLKKEINEILAGAGQPPRYPLDFDKDPEGSASSMRAPGLKNWLTFGLSPQQEDRFRRASLAQDLALARICLLLLNIPNIGLAFNDYRFFGGSWKFAILQAWKLGLLGYTFALIAFTRKVKAPRAYDRAAFVWGLFVVATVLGFVLTRPPDFFGHAITVVIMLFVFLLALPGSFLNQIVLASLLSLGEPILILARSRSLAFQAGLAIVVGIFAAYVIALLSSRQIHAYRRRAFLAQEGEKAALGALHEIGERRQADEALAKAKEMLEARILERTAALQTANAALLESRRAALNVMEDALAARRRADQLAETLEQRVRERTEALLKSSENLRAETKERLRLAAALEQSEEGIAILDPEGRIDYFNPAFEKIHGDGGRVLRGDDYYGFLGAEGEEADLPARAAAALGRGEKWTGRVRRPQENGSVLEFDVSLSPIRDPGGALAHSLVVERDVTLEARMQQHIRQMQKVEALGTLAGGIAHDFNNLLNPIFINTEMALLDAPADDRLRQNLQTVLKAAERGKDLVKQIITFSRQKERELKPVMAGPLVKEASKFLRASLPQTIEIREEITDGQGFILADPTQIHQVVMNLCSNSAFAMRDHGGVLEIGLAGVEVDAEMARMNPDLKPGPYLRLTVADTGTGMTKSVQERAFDPFFTTKKPGEGTGMGLAIVHGIVKDSGGAVTVYSEPGKGTAFNIFFPRVEAEGSFKSPSAAPPRGGRERILIVDDEEGQVESVRNALRRLGYAVTAMSDSQKALDLFRKDSSAFDLVITDQTMPHMTGLELAGEILRMRPGFPVILCTGFSEKADSAGAQAGGIRGFLMKPFSVREISETIRRVLDNS